MDPKHVYFANALEKRIEQERYRQMRCVMPVDESHLSGKEGHIVNFGSSDFLALSQNSFVKKKTIQYVLEWGAGSTASRLVIGHLECQKRLEETLAKRLGFESALLFSSPLQAWNVIASALLGPRSALFIDSHCPLSITQATRVSGVKPVYFSDADDLYDKLFDARDTPIKLVITEALGEALGTRADLPRLIETTKEAGALLCVDDSQTFGVMGEKGMGLGASEHSVDFILSAFGKACGSVGAFVACSNLMRDYLAHFSDGISWQNPLPPAALGAIEASIDLIPDMEAERELIANSSAYLREELSNFDWNLGDATDHILPLLVPEEELFDLSEHLANKGILTSVVKPKCGPMRLKLAINATHTRKELNMLLEALSEFSALV